MEYVKGCDVCVLTNYLMKKFEKGKLLIADELKEQLSLESLKQMVAMANAPLINDEGKEDKGRAAGLAYAMIKKIEKKRYLIGITTMKRYDGGPTGKTGVAAWFAASTDTYVMQERYFAPGLDKEEAFFDECVLSQLKSIVSMEQAKKAEYLDKMVVRVEERKILGITISRTLFFLFMMFTWGAIFKNLGLGICFAFMFLTSFTMITSRAKTEEGKKTQMSEANTGERLTIQN